MKPMLNILLVDDSRVILERLTLLLAELSNVARILPACSNLEAKQLLQQEVVDVVIIDMDMPDGNGLRLLQMISRQHLAGLIIAITECADYRRKRLYESYGASHYMDKFDDIEQIQSIIAGFAWV